MINPMSTFHQCWGAGAGKPGAETFYRYQEPEPVEKYREAEPLNHLI